MGIQLSEGEVKRVFRARCPNEGDAERVYRLQRHNESQGGRIYRAQSQSDTEERGFTAQCVRTAASNGWRLMESRGLYVIRLVFISFGFHDNYTTPYLNYKS